MREGKRLEKSWEVLQSTEIVIFITINALSFNAVIALDKIFYDGWKGKVNCEYRLN